MKFNGYDHLKKWEGCELEAYKDVVGVWTIGYGSTGSHVYPGKKITQAEANALLDKDLVRFEEAVNSLVKAVLTQNQYDALVSLAYNIGVGGFSTSTVLRRINAGDFNGAADAFLMWNKGRQNGRLVVIKGLTNRRKSERELFLTPDSVPVGPDQPTLFTHAVESLMKEYTDKIISVMK